MIKHPEPREAGELPRSVRLGSASLTMATTAAVPSSASPHVTLGQPQHAPLDALVAVSASCQSSTAASRPAEDPRSAARSPAPHGSADPGPRQHGRAQRH